MDIKREREAFEKSNNVHPDWSFKFDHDLDQYIAVDHEMQLQVDEFNEHWDTFRAGWLAAKQQAAPDGYNLVKIPNKAGNPDVDWAKAPAWAKYWLKDGHSNKFWWSSNRPSIDRDLTAFVWRGNHKVEQAPSFGFNGDWSKSMTSRKAMIQEAQK